MHHEESFYIGCLLFDDLSFCRHISQVLKFAAIVPSLKLEVWMSPTLSNGRTSNLFPEVTCSGYSLVYSGFRTDLSAKMQSSLPGRNNEASRPSSHDVYGCSQLASSLVVERRRRYDLPTGRSRYPERCNAFDHSAPQYLLLNRGELWLTIHRGDVVERSCITARKVKDTIPKMRANDR